MMALLTHNHHLVAFIFGLLGNIVSFMVFLAPVPTFCKICKRKSSEGFHSIPYAVALMSAMLLLYYGFLKTNATLIITINGFGCAIELIYLMLYIFYAPRKEKIFTLKLMVLFNLGAFGIMILLVLLLVNGSNRVNCVGWICAAFSLAVFVAPLSIMTRVIKTKSVEYMPFGLSFFLTLSAILWFFYGFFLRDYFIALPNVLGFLFGMAQMVLYIMYKDPRNDKDGFRQEQDSGVISIEVKVSSAPTIEDEKLHAETNNDPMDLDMKLVVLDDDHTTLKYNPNQDAL